MLPTAISKNIVHEYNMDAVYKTKYTIDSRYLEFQGAHWNTSRYPYLDISELREWGKQ